MYTTAKSILAHKGARWIVFLFVVFAFWRVYLLATIPDTNVDLWNGTWYSFWWGGLYQLIAIAGGVIGITIASHWGGMKSTLGRAITVISVGLLLQAFGQSVATYYVYYNRGGLYPSIADIGFFGSVIAYIYGGISLVSLAGGRVAFKSALGKFLAFIVPAALLAGSYFIFLQGYELDFSNKLKILLDLGYPLGQALYVSMAIVALLLSRNLLGGIMKTPIMFLLAAFIFQYLSDYSFLYQNSHGTYIAGGFVDVMYMISYFIMSISLVRFGVAMEEIKQS